MAAVDPHKQTPPPSSQWSGRLVIALLFGTLLLLSYLVLEDFLVPLLWAAILAYVTWPLNKRMRRALKQRRALAALAMTLFLIFAIVLPLLAVIASLRQEVIATFEALSAILASGSAALPAWLREIPWLGAQLTGLVDRVTLAPQISGAWLGEAAGLLGVVGRNAMKFALALVASFFFYRDGQEMVIELRRGLRCLLGARSHTYWIAAAGMTQAVVYGLVLTALAQGALAGLGYWVVGADAPVLLGALTALFALIPFGAPVVWGGVGLWLLAKGSIFFGVALLLWGALVVSSVDNVIRPLVISASTNISFLLVLFGVLGGLNAFGLVGLFLGPVVLAVLWAVWRHWLELNDAGCRESGR